MRKDLVKDSILEIQVNAALAGHDIGPFEPVDNFEWKKFYQYLYPD
jgi:hypothetical protein